MSRLLCAYDLQDTFQGADRAFQQSTGFLTGKLHVFDRSAVVRVHQLDESHRVVGIRFDTEVIVHWLRSYLYMGR